MASDRKKATSGKQGQEERDKSAADYYKLKTKSIDDLVNADVSNSPKVSPEEIARYSGRSKAKWKIPGWGKAIFIKFWFYAAICFFFIWGLGGYLSNLLDQLFVIGVAIGLITDILTNNALRFVETTEGENNRWMLFPKKSYLSFLLNIIYGFVITFFVYTLYNMVNLAAMRLTGNEDRLFLTVEPIVFGIFCVLVDLMFIGMKHLLFRIIEDAKKSNK